MSFDPIPYDLLPNFLHWLKTIGGFAAIVLVVAFMTSIVANGLAGPRVLFQRLRDGFHDLTRLSCRRIWALAMLTFKEAVRRKALMVFVVFGILFMFAGWFLANPEIRSDLQASVYVSFVLRTITFLVVPVVLLLSCWGLPEDIRLRSLHTVVTKPARRSEIVIGRMLGFTLISTLVLTIMSVIGYVWIMRQLPNDANLVARVPIYGQLGFLNREGSNLDENGNLFKGFNTGDMWMFRGYIEGATKSRGIYTFTDLTPVDKLNFEARFEAFRTHKGVMGKGLLCRLILVNEEKDLRVPLPAFEVAEFSQNELSYDRAVSYYDEDSKSMQTVDIFNDMAPDGTLTVEVQALDVGQFIGMARPNLFVRMPHKNFAVGYFKAAFGIWLLLSLVIVLSVTASTFVKGPVATLLVFALLIVGQTDARELMGELVLGQQEGGGPFESAYRLVTHMNPTVALPETPLTPVLLIMDWGIVNFLWLVENIIPNFSYFAMSAYPANGFDVPWSAAMLPSIAITFAYLIPCLLIGYYSLSLRELEAK